MFALPEHIHAISKPNGRNYYYFAKHRSTPDAWPRIRVPADPLSVEFAGYVALFDRLAASLIDGLWTFFLVDVTGRRHSLPAPDDPETFWKAATKAEQLGRQVAAGVAKTFSALIMEFKESAAYQLKSESSNGKKGISKSTREQYDRCLKVIEAAWGDDPVSKLTPEEAQKAIDAFRDTPAAGRVFRSVLSRLISWGIPRGYAPFNVVEHTEDDDEGGTYEPWPLWAFELFFANARIGLHMPIYSALFTGQRKGDLLNMKRPIEGVTEMPIIAQKTDEIVPIQIHSEYRSIIRALPALPLNEDGTVKTDRLHLREDGVPWTYEGFNTAWQREMDRKVFKPFRENRLVPHGVRKNAVNNLLEIGCSEAQVGAIVKMSPAMVRHYSKRINQFRLARGAMKQFEDGWSALRPLVLGNVRTVQ